MNHSTKLANLYHFNSEAPDLLLKKIAELEQTINTAKEAKHKNQKAIDFYTSILATMKFAWAYMIDFQWVHERNHLLTGENEFLRKWAADLKDRCMKYELIEQLKLTGDFDATVAKVDEYLNNHNIKNNE